MQITLQSIATIHNNRTEAIDDEWGEIISEITLESHIPSKRLDSASG